MHDTDFPREPAGPVLTGEESRLWQEAFLARDEARSRLAQSEALLQQQREAAREEAWQAAWQEAQSTLHQAMSDYFQRLEPQLLDVVRSIVIQIMGETPPATLLAARVRQQLQQFHEQENVTLWVAPLNVDALRQALADPALPEAGWLTVQGDPAMTAWQASLSGPQRSVDVGVHAMLARLEAIFNDAGIGGGAR
ncbi:MULTISPECIES: FliH/SctL family protein [Klebsiella/Raoultella group]|uniref:FliH/SctL family protein n=1 Tax=Klebsiella/Raoultella group TaxID=2890311 RepID=UPI00100A1013|nr:MULTISPECIES: FliH/SctL family protein [Klebsiella/Raoultella group]QAV82118.1 hypothetical protein ES964_26965 [Klebsiella pneumoniae]WFW01846.1 FliH/SctL family protein [Klebsiella aerogenes]WSI11166.1 FliH/SctL family protein [Klebsiella pneumoniae]